MASGYGRGASRDAFVHRLGIDMGTVGNLGLDANNRLRQYSCRCRHPRHGSDRGDVTRGWFFFFGVLYDMQVNGLESCSRVGQLNK